MRVRTIPILLFLVFMLFFSLLGAPVASASGILELNDSKNEYDLTPYISVLEDKENRLVVYDFLQPEMSDRFVESTGNTLSYGYSSSNYWAKLKIRNISNKEDWLLEIAYPPMDSVEMYVMDGSNTVVQKHAGDDNPFPNREVKNRNLVFKVPINQGDTLELYLRFHSQGSMVMPMKIIHPVYFAQKEQTSYLLLGGYYGIIIIMSIYNSFLAFSFRSKVYLYFALHCTSSLLMFSTLNGISFQFIWPEAVWWNSRAAVCFLCLSHIAALLFARNFLPIRSISSKLNPLYNLFIGFEILNIFLLAVNYTLALQVSMIKILLYHLLMVVPGIQSLRAGFKPAWYYLFGWGIFLICAIPTMLTDAGFIPMSRWTIFGAQIGSTLETLILSWGLANQIQRMRKEKDLAVEQMQESRKLAESDFLTGLYNRRYFMNMFASKLGSNEHDSMAFLILDVDHFKQINDTYGHDAGDIVLQKIAAVLKQCFRQSDIISRFGGEEFIVLMADTNIHQARYKAEHLLVMIRNSPFDTGKERIYCTISIGITEWKKGDKDDFQHVLRKADAALYEAKRLGRNRICLADS
ncbi:sensor domain-containing diguanylate cyclase [Paenibacillus sedimenti]|uniref:GGDEF domain-containing protein n=1 Tax=Paenibacillus sedimenti TaxID=2770274 RepID=A0A926QI07_9BACL|nr:diguanylate cyclase [Paenibacillus sedimenti]MBD0380035.1 GGDEF domain-containing protein [Paenibacillus sedimenti]